MKYKFPLRIPDSWKLTVTQGFHENHNGNDVAVDDGVMTFGIPFVWCFPFPGKPYEIQVDTPVAALATKARAQVDGTDPATGITYSIIGLHLSSSPYTVLPGSNTDIVFKQGDTIAHLGNSGVVRPLPTPEKPFDGSHIHLALGIKKPGEANYTMVDPSIYFDVTNPFRGADDLTKDDPIYKWAHDKATLPSAKLTFLGQSMMSTNPTQARIVLAVAMVIKAFGS